MAKRAMTLVEVIAALAILVVLSGGVLGFFFGLTERRDELALLASQQRDVASLLDRLEAALMTCVAVAPDGSAGVRGDGVSVAIATRTVGAVFEGRASVADASRLGLAFDREHASCQCTLEPLTGEAGQLSEPVLAEVSGMRFRYLQGRDWSDTFDSLSDGGLPGAIEVSIWLAPRRGEPAPGPLPDASAGGSSGEPDPTRAESEPGWGGGASLSADAAAWESREPDYTRLIVVPDGPEAGWTGGTP